VNTLGKFSFQYGRLDISVKIPRTADGLWPARRLVGADYGAAGWPECGEITLMEMGHHSGIAAKTQHKLLSGGAHWGPARTGERSSNQAVFKTNHYALQYGAYHLFTLLWNRERIRMYLDVDKLTPEQRAQAKPYFEMEITPELEKYFCKPFSVLINTAAGGGYTGIDGENGVTALNKGNNFQAAMYIEYIRVYDQQGKLLFNDEFNGSRLDTTKWNVEEGVSNNEELQTYRRQNVRIDKDRATGKNCLVLSTRRENL
jgi:beta-glucanase (GH16 family)